MLRHALWTLAFATTGAAVYLAAKIVVRLAQGESLPNVVGASVLWLVVALVSLLGSRRARVRIGAATLQLRGGGLDWNRSCPRDSIQSVEITAGLWPSLELGLRGGRRISFSLLTLTPPDRQRVAAALTAAVASR